MIKHLKYLTIGVSLMAAGFVACLAVMTPVVWLGLYAPKALGIIIFLAVAYFLGMAITRGLRVCE